MRKAQSLSFNTIVIAALALIVLIVLIMIFTSGFRQSGETVQGLGSCAQQGGTCQTTQQQGENCFFKLGECGDEGKESQPYCCISNK